MITIQSSKNMCLTLLAVKDVVLSLLFICMCACQCDCVVYNSVEEKKKKGVRVCDFLFGACNSLTERKRFAVCRLFFFVFLCV